MHRLYYKDFEEIHCEERYSFLALDKRNSRDLKREEIEVI